MKCALQDQLEEMHGWMVMWIAAVLLNLYKNINSYSDLICECVVLSGSEKLITSNT